MIKGCNTFLGQKLANTCSFVGERIIVQQEKNLESRMQLDESVECASGGDPLLLYKILHLLFSVWYEFLVHCALRVEKSCQHGLDAGPIEFQFLRPRGVSPTHSELCRFVSGSQAKHQVTSLVIILFKNFCLHRPSR